MRMNIKKFVVFIMVLLALGLIISINSGYISKIADNATGIKSNYTELKNLEYRFGLLLYDENMNFMTERKIAYSSSNINRTVTFVNLTDKQSNFMLIVLLNGILQKFSAFGNKMDYTYKSVIGSEIEINIPVSIQCDDKLFTSGENRLLFTVLYDIDKVPSLNNNHILFYSCTFPCEIVLPDMYPNKLFQPAFSNKNIIDKPKSLDNQFNGILYSSLCNNESGKEMIHKRNFIFNSEEEEMVTVQTVGPPGEYSSILFCDNEPVFIENVGTNVFFKIDENSMFSRDYKISYNSEGQLYALTIPLNIGLKYPITSEKSSYHYVK